MHAPAKKKRTGKRRSVVPANERLITSIRIGKRHRKSVGDIASLAASIEQVGLLHAVVVKPDGELIAGERRLRACQSLGMKRVPVRIVNIDNVTRGELAENVEREPFLPSEIEAIRRELEPVEKEAARKRMRDGAKGVESFHTPLGKTRDKIGAFAGISGRTVEKIAAVVAAADADPQRFGGLVKRMDKGGKVDQAFKLLKVARARDAYAARREQGGRVSDLVALAESGYRAACILADPPWPWETWGEYGKIHTACDHHFSTMTLDEIEAFGEQYVLPLAADDCVLLLWVTWPRLLAARGVIEACGFDYKTLGFDWIKTNPDGVGLHTGNGYWTRSNSEVCLLATRGKPQRLEFGVHQVILAPVGDHSEKPDEVHERIERLVASPYLELFARRERSGWSTWGDEVPPPVVPQRDQEVVT